jgi:phosphoribosyl-dephospho-CoA transferase
MPPTTPPIPDTALRNAHRDSVANSRRARARQAIEEHGAPLLLVTVGAGGHVEVSAAEGVDTAKVLREIADSLEKPE